MKAGVGGSDHVRAKFAPNGEPQSLFGSGNPSGLDFPVVLGCYSKPLAARMKACDDLVSYPISNPLSAERGDPNGGLSRQKLLAKSIPGRRTSNSHYYLNHDHHNIQHYTTHQSSARLPRLTNPQGHGPITITVL
jgi:hypothetical protein